MIIQNRRKLLLTSAAAIVLSLASTSALASAMGYEGGDDDDSDYKTAGCSLIGCPNGNRLCGTASGTIKAGVPPFVGEVSVSYTCYESYTF